MKKVFSLLLVLCLVIMAGCSGGAGGSSSGSDNGAGGDGSYTADGGYASDSNGTPDHHIYKYMKISNPNAGSLYYHSYDFADPSVVSSGDDYYYPNLIAEFDPNTGKAIAVQMYCFFLDGPDDEWANNAIETFNNGASDEIKSEVTNLSKGRVNEFVSYFCCSIDPESYGFDQYIQNLFYEQDIEEYKNDVYFDRLYNYSSEPPHSEGENFFSDTLTMTKIEWSDNEVYPLVGQEVYDY